MHCDMAVPLNMAVPVNYSKNVHQIYNAFEKVN